MMSMLISSVSGLLSPIFFLNFCRFATPSFTFLPLTFFYFFPNSAIAAIYYLFTSQTVSVSHGLYPSLTIAVSSSAVSDTVTLLTL